MTIIITLLTFWGTLLYGARYLLNQSFFVNVPLLFVFAVIIFFIFCIISSVFKAILNEFDGHLLYAEALMFTTLPILCSSVVTWCLCIEIPDLDLPLCFGGVFAAYLALLMGPRKSVMGSIRDSKQWEFIVSQTNLLLNYCIPCVISPVLYLVVHRGVLMTMLARCQGMLLSFAFPSLLVVQIAERHLAYWDATKQKDIYSRYFEIWKMLLIIMLTFAVKDHPFFDDIKIFSQNTLLPHSLSTPLLFLTCYMIFFAVHYYRGITKTGLQEEDVFGISRGATSSSVLFNHPWMSACVIIISLSISLLSGVQPGLIPMFVCGALALSEYYIATSCGMLRGRRFLGAILVLFGVAPVALVFDSFCEVTLRFLSFNLHWSPEIDISINSLCNYCIIMAVSAVVLPSILAGRAPSSTDLLPWASEASYFWSGAASTVFSFGFFLISAAVSLLELLVREQVWGRDYYFLVVIVVVVVVVYINSNVIVYTFLFCDVTLK